MRRQLTLTRASVSNGRLKGRSDKALLHQYAGAETGRDRKPPRPLRNPDSALAQVDSQIMTRRSQDLGHDSAFFDYLISQYQTYAFGDVSYIPNTGSKKSNQIYRDYWCEWMNEADIQGRHHFLDMLQLGWAGMATNGRHGFIHHHNTDGTFQLQAIMGYNIGNPRAIYTNPALVSGTVIDTGGRVVAYDLYKLGINGTVHFVKRVPAAIFSILNPVKSADEYAAKTPFAAVLNDAHDMKVIENAWMQKVKWAAFKPAIFNTPNGSAPDPNGEGLDSDGSAPAQSYIRFQLPGEELHGEEGFKVEMLKNETPTSNEMELLTMKIAQLAMALRLPFSFVWVNLAGLPGTAVRLTSEQAKRAFQYGPLGQKWVERVALNNIKKMALLSGIIRGVIPHEDNWNRGSFMYPAHPTVDAGRDSKANIEENARGLLPMAVISAEQGRYWEDDDEQLANEAENKMLLAYRTSKNFNDLTGEVSTWKDALPMIQANSANPPAPGENSDNKPPEQS